MKIGLPVSKVSPHLSRKMFDLPYNEDAFPYEKGERVRWGVARINSSVERYYGGARRGRLASFVVVGSSLGTAGRTPKVWHFVGIFSIHIHIFLCSNMYLHYRIACAISPSSRSDVGAYPDSRPQIGRAHV